MSNIDQFESVFRSAARDVFRYERVEFSHVLVLTDLDASAADAFAKRAQEFAQVLGKESPVKWEAISGDRFQTTGDLLELVGQKSPDLIVTYRNLHSRAWRFPHSLGEHLDVLVQKTSIPVLVLPHPEADYASDHALESTGEVMVMTDHLSDDHKLVNHAVRFTQPGGKLFLAHIEDETSFDRVMKAIGRIPSIDTDDAHEKLRHQLLKLPHDYIQSCRNVLDQVGVKLQIEEFVGFGHHLSKYSDLIAEHKIDLLVMNTKDEDQLAMHGLAYPLAVEVRQIPLLML